MMKRAISLFLCFVLILSMLGSVGASPREPHPFKGLDSMEEIRKSPAVSDYFSKSAVRGEDDPLRWAYYPDYGILEITGTGPMPDFSVYNDSRPWHEFKDYIYGVYIDDKVTYIGKHAFEHCGYILEVYLGESLETIGSHGFSGCYCLESVEFPSCLKTIEDYGFSSSGLRNVVIPDTVETLGMRVFESCPKLETAYVGAGVTSMGIDVFDSCDRLQTAELAEGVTELPAGTFHSCDTLQKVVLPESLTTIGYDALSHIGSLQVVRIPSKVESLPVELFWDTSLVCVTLPAELKNVYACAFENVKTLDHIFFCGTEEQWNAVNISGSANEALYNATIHFESDEDISYRYTKDMEKYIYCNICNKDIGKGTVYTTFHDISYDQYYFTPVAWAAEAGITTGTTPFTFAPDKVCTRAQIVTFLWRAKGCPMPTAAECAFTDVSRNAYYYLPVLWAVEQGITTGVNATEFKPDSPCTRAQVATFLWRAEGSPEAQTTTSPFTDVIPNSYYEKAVLWATEKGITNGTEPTTFSPDKECTRGQIVTFLFRAVHQS